VILPRPPRPGEPAHGTKSGLGGKLTAVKDSQTSYAKSGINI